MALQIPPDRRFRRQPRPVRHARLRSRWWWQLLRSTTVLGALAAGVHQAALYAVAAPVLTVRHVVVDGNRQLSSGEAAALLDGLVGQNLLTADLHAWRERLRASSWVSDAELRRRIPATVEVHIHERTPIGLARTGGDLFLVDASGAIIDEFGPRYADYDLPIIDGLFVAGRQGSAADEERGRLVAEMMADVRRRPDVAGRVSQIDISHARDVRVILDGDPTVVRLGDTRFLERIGSYIELLAALKERVPAIDYVDLRFDGRVYVGPAPLGAPAPDAAGATGGPAKRGPQPSGTPSRTPSGDGRRVEIRGT